VTIAAMPEAGDPIPVLWICGPAGVGKTTAAWQIYSSLTAAGIRTGFADIDQLGMCYPAPESDPGRYQMQARNLGAVAANFRAAGAQCMIVSGVVDPAGGMPASLMPAAALTLARLRADSSEIVRRLTGRTRSAEDEVAEAIKESLAEVAAFDASDFADVCLDITDVPAAEVPVVLRQRCRDWPGFSLKPSAPTAGERDR
jgi:hypothetical protein